MSALWLSLFLCGIIHSPATYLGCGETLLVSIDTIVPSRCEGGLALALAYIHNPSSIIRHPSSCVILYSRPPCTRTRTLDVLMSSSCPEHDSTSPSSCERLESGPLRPRASDVLIYCAEKNPEMYIHIEPHHTMNPPHNL